MKLQLLYAQVLFSDVLNGLEVATRISRTDPRAQEFCDDDADRLEQYAKRIRILLATKDKPVKVKRNDR